ncbi:histidine phosphatase family protein [uncultured Lactobacillus sp.]|uniref:histidine phosphatase family protein n=1 Tax=uncultured Lactobacillus sp. TaxID=153152 RepID=UPI00261F6CCF|nr:histidine phosphatase family protein [uncultured Lactobacillus sp.]
MTTVYFVRHAQPDLSVHDDLTRPLTKKGLQDRERVVNYFRDKGIDQAFSSPFKRAIDTIQPVLNEKQLTPTIIADFRERKIGNEWISDFHEYCKKQWENFDYKLENGESLKETQNRNIAALKQVLKECQGQTIIISGHGTAIGSVINYYDSNFKYKDFALIQPKTPFIAKLSFDGEKYLGYEVITF